MPVSVSVSFAIGTHSRLQCGKTESKQSNLHFAYKMYRLLGCKRMSLKTKCVTFIVNNLLCGYWIKVVLADTLEHDLLQNQQV